MIRHFLLFCMIALTASPAVAYDGRGITSGRYHTRPIVMKKRAAGERYNYRVFNADSIRARVAADSRYQAVIARYKASIEPLLGMSDDEVRHLILPAHTIRAFMVNRAGCPVHGGGTAVYQPFGISVDLTHPHQVRCTIGGEWYPNDEFPDDGSSWLDTRSDSPTKGQRFYFKGWFQHWFLKTIGDRLKTLAQLWIITGDDVYRAKAVALLDRFADIYPDIDPNECTYSGDDWGVYVKMTGSYWEGATLLNTALAVEILYPTLPPEFVEKIHTNIYLAAYDAYKARPVSGNWGNNWNPALAKFASILGDDEMLDFMRNNHPAAESPVLDNQFFRDGIPYEASLSYASTYHYVALNIAEALGEDGTWIWEHPHMRESFDSFARLVCLDKYTHFAGDMGSIVNKGWMLPAEYIEKAYNAYRTPLVARYLYQARQLYGFEGPEFLDELFTEPLDIEEVKSIASEAPPLKSTIAPVRGIAVLRTGTGDGRSALVFDYGYAHAAHHHADRLNINYYAFGRDFISEMGYPEYMDHTAPATGGWTTHTVCHATVEVDEKRQNPGVFGDLNAFADVEGVKYIDASCEDAYAYIGVDRYRRSLALIDVTGGSYAVDIFRVRGGKKQDYLFHGPQMAAKVEGVSLSSPRKGTLAGKDVPFGTSPGGVDPYSTDNSGYQYLYDVREKKTDKQYKVTWTAGNGVTFVARFVPDGSENAVAAMGYPRPSSKQDEPMPFFLRRKSSSKAPLESTFITVMNAEKGAPLIQEVTRLKLSPDSTPGAVALAIKHDGGVDIVLSTLSTDGKAVTSDGRYSLDGLFGAVIARKGAPSRLVLVGGKRLKADSHEAVIDEPVFETTIRSLTDDRIATDAPIPVSDEGATMYIVRGGIRSVYTVDTVIGSVAALSPSTWIGRGRIAETDIEAGKVADDRRIFPLGDGFEKERNYYRGAWIVPLSDQTCYRLTRGGHWGFFLDKGFDGEAFAKSFQPGGEFLLYDAGPGDTVSIIRSVNKSVESR